LTAGATARCALGQQAAARLLAVGPSRFEVKDHRGERTRILYDVDEAAWNRAAVVQRLEQIGAHGGFRCWTSPLRHELPWPWTNPYFDDDVHWTADGRRTAAHAGRDVLGQAYRLGVG
jgi:hypothetical protein